MAGSLFEHDQVARAIVVATVVAAVAGEAIATYVGQHRGGGRHGVRGLLGAAFESTFVRARGSASADRWTKQILVVGMVLALFAASKIGKDEPSLRVGANGWPTFALGIALVLAGIGLRCWAVVALGRFFRRVVAVDDQHVVLRSGPYRFVRHPAYAGNLLVAFGFGLVFGSWVGALVAGAIALVAHLPRIHVEETALEAKLGLAYRSYESSTPRLVPGVW